ncbi:MAG: diacylglycerol kinase [Spirochaetae bacterium HGW-Spirochaetae-5]|nr:MAG: diacylglycerol kinase [Spirochaetae bacterium HGW-Spirochaetae-5]
MKKWLYSVDNAIEGILHAAKTERHVRFHLYSAAALLVVCFTFGINKWEFIILTIMAAVVIVAEMFNSAIESVVDLVSPHKQERARIAKDIAAGAVLISSFVSLAAAYFILKPYVSDFYYNGIRIARHTGDDIAVASLIIIMIFVVILKAYLGQVHPLKGGMPSGHAALSFSLFVSISLTHPAPPVIILSLLLAVIISSSRVFLKIHSFIEVFAGAVLGSVTTFLLFKMFY